jgi:hypothetical protein
MNRIHFAAVAATFVTASLAANLLLIGTWGPMRLNLPVRLRFGSRWLGRRIKRAVDFRVAAMIARRQAIYQLSHTTGTDPMDIALHRGGVDRDGGHAARAPLAGARAAFGISRAAEGKR